MRPVSERFLSSLRGSQGAVTQAFVVAAGQTGTSPDGDEIAIFSGDVQLDATAAIRSTLDLTTDGTRSFPQRASDALAPYGNEIFVRRGLSFGGGSVEWVSLGYFRINTTGQDDQPDGPIRIAAQDRMSGIAKARLLAPRQFSAVTTFGSVMEELITEVYPWATIEWDDFTETDPLGRTLIAEEDRRDFLDDLVTSVGKIWYWDHRGVLVIRNPADPSDAVWEVNTGENGVLLEASRELTNEGVYNAVVATGEALDTTPPPRGVAVDNSPSSPTYWFGSFGKVPRFYSSSFITTDAQAANAAAGILRSTLGLPYSVDFQSIVNPALEPWDPVSINVFGRSETHVIKSLTIPFAVDTAMTADTQEQTLVVIGDV